MIRNILLCGVGGQGIILTSKLIAAAAMENGMNVMSAETIGMAQKGGSVFSFLRMGDEEIACPAFGEGTADIIIGFEPGETVRMLKYLKKDGVCVTNTHAVMPVTASLSGARYSGSEMLSYLKENTAALYPVDGEGGSREIGSPKVLNMIMLGAAIRSGVLPFDIRQIKEVMKRTVKPQFHEMNLAALDYSGK